LFLRLTLIPSARGCEPLPEPSCLLIPPIFAEKEETADESKEQKHSNYEKHDNIVVRPLSLFFDPSLVSSNIFGCLFSGLFSSLRFRKAPCCFVGCNSGGVFTFISTRGSGGTRKPAKASVKKAANKRVAKSPTEKTAWRISPEISQSVVDIDIWKKDDLKIEHLKVYRSGWIIVDQLPDLSGYNPDEGVNILEEFAVEEHQLLDGSEGTSFFPKELPSEECERLMTLSEAELVDEGWTIESATRFTGPLVVEEV
jgi:hypothetical protein